MKLTPFPSQKVCGWGLVICTLCSLPSIAQEESGGFQKFELQEGDRVVFLGSEFTEQATKHNFFEAELTARWPSGG